MSIGGNELLAEVENAFPRLGIYLRSYLVPAVENTAQNAAVGTTAQLPAPDPPESVGVTTAGEMLQVVVTHNAPVQKGIQYITHIATNPQFLNPMIHDHGSSRAPVTLSLPTKDSTGATHSYYVATIAQYQGGPPSAPAYFGGKSPTAVTMSGTTEMDIQPGTGSGTASNGGQPFVGIGKSQIRLAPGPKRSV